MRWMALVVVATACASRSAPPTPIATATPAPATTTAPAKKKVTVTTETRVDILDPIKFLPGSATIEATSIPMLDAVARTLAGNPSIRLVAVQAFGADTVARYQGQLGATRAQTIVDELVARGIEAKRLVAEGNAQPPAGYSNAPIFTILERAP